MLGSESAKFVHRCWRRFTNVPVFVYIDRQEVYESRGEICAPHVKEAKGDMGLSSKGLKMPMENLFHGLAPFALLSAADAPLQNLSTLDPASPPTESIRFLFIFAVAIGLFILAIVWGVLFYSLIRFRHSKKSRVEGATEPPQVYGSLPIEIAWTVAPGLIVLILSLVIVRTELEVRANLHIMPPGAVQIGVIGHQWWWEYIVKSDGNKTFDVVTANEIHVPVSQAVGAANGSDEKPVDRPIFLHLQSADVCHSFWIPRLAGKTDLIPGRDENYQWFQTTEPGLYLGQCAEYCGTQHANMLLRVYVDTEDVFAAWLANEQKPAVDDPAVQDGRQAFLSQSCVNCHTIRGTAAHGKVGPDLTHLAARQTIGGGMIELNVENLQKWITDPQQIKTGCLMPAFGLSGRKVQLITEYLMSLK
jgi:cytochrome c oxidase subunit II